MNKINEIQDIVINQLRKISKDVKKEDLEEELNLATVISNTAQTFIKSANLNLKIYEYAKANKIDIDELNKRLGL